MNEVWWKDPWVRSIIKMVLRGALIFGVLALFAQDLSADEVYKFVLAWLGVEGTNLIPSNTH